jgi:acid phosphatase family membrane protein YuiD
VTVDTIDHIIYNRPLIAAITASISAQTLKFLLYLIKNNEIDIGRAIGNGGMPSSHSAFVMALATKIGMLNGFASAFFAIAMAFALIVMQDAAGVRRATGNQARILNLIIDDLSKRRPIKQERLKELIGHTPFEVIAGAFLGVFIGIII